jgi:3-oxoacyl-[acyl-carrier protein] reductase
VESPVSHLVNTTDTCKKMNISLKGKNALVGGASAGIGLAVARELALLGANVTLVARREALLKEVLGTLHNDGHQEHAYLVADYADSEGLLTAVETLLAQRVVHILINNTGGPPGGPITEASAAAFESAYHNHLICNQLLAKAVLPGMKEASYGRIINIISTSVKEPLDGLGVSNSTRWAVAAWAKTWAGEVARFGITVNNVLPGFTATDRLSDLIEKRASAAEVTQESIEQTFLNTVPARRFAQPEEVAAAVAFLATPAAAYITGINLPVDGGRTRSL